MLDAEPRAGYATQPLTGCPRSVMAGIADFLEGIIGGCRFGKFIFTEAWIRRLVRRRVVNQRKYAGRLEYAMDFGNELWDIRKMVGGNPACDQIKLISSSTCLFLAVKS